MEDIHILKQRVIQSLNLRVYYEAQLKTSIEADSEGWSQKLLCPFHTDTSPSLNVNVLSGGFKCFACPDEKQGSVFDFHNWMCGRDGRDKTNFRKALTALAKEAGVDLGKYALEDDATPVMHLPSDIRQTEVKPQYTVQRLNSAEKADQTITPISPSIIEGYHKQLRPEHYTYLNQKRGLTAATIKLRQIGWDRRSKVMDNEKQVSFGRYTIPILSRDGECRNVRKYSPDASSECKVINTKGFGSPARLYLLPELLAKDWRHVCICEGELDCILLNQKFADVGIDRAWGAVTGTHGCTKFMPEWLDHLYGRSVYFVLDCDVPGKGAAADITTKYFLTPLKQGKFDALRVVDLPLDGSKEYKDITDYFVKSDHKIEDFLALCEHTPLLEPGGMALDEATIKPIEVESFVDCIKNRKYIDKRVRVPLTISGQTSKLFHATREYAVVRCPAKDECCSKDSGPRILPYGHDLFIQACMATKSQMQHALRCIACTADKKCTVESVKKVVMEEYFAHQVIKRWRAEENAEGRMENVQQQTMAPIYILQPDANVKIEPKNYIATGWVRSHPNTQQATLFVENLEPLDDEWRDFKLDSVNLQTLTELKQHPVGDILDQITNNVTRIYESDEILMSVLLTYLSPLWFTFDSELIRGWINTCIIGDSGTGKSATYQRVADWLGLGDLFSVLTGTRTGLLYALKQNGSEWYVHVGRYVTASEGIIAIDETQEMLAEEIKKMAIAMDTGWLEVNQVAQAGYDTKTRTIFLMNPPDGMKISDFPYGCLAMARCFDPMFIRRIDMAVFCTSKDEYGFYNQKFKPSEKNTLTADMMRKLIYWTWTRTAADIHFYDSAVTACLESAKQLTEKYGQADDILLIDPQGFRKKLARLSVAFAILSCNFTDDFKGVNVEELHVKVMAEFLDTVYSSVSCNLLQYAKLSKGKKILLSDDFEKIKLNFETVIKNATYSTNKEYAAGKYFCQLLLLLQQTSESIRIRDLKDQLGVSMKWVQRHIAILRAYNLVEIVRSAYKPTRKFNIFMQRWQQDPQIEADLENVHLKIGQSALLKDDTDEWYGRSAVDSEASEASEADDPFASFDPVAPESDL